MRAAEDEGRLLIHSTTDERVAAPLVADFRQLYPRIAVTYEDLSRRGQTTMASLARLHALRENVQGAATGAAYRDFILRWRAALGRGGVSAAAPGAA